MKKYKIEDFTYCGAECYNVCYGTSVCVYDLSGLRSMVLIRCSGQKFNRTSKCIIINDTITALDGTYIDANEFTQCLLHNNINSTIPVYE